MIVPKTEPCGLSRRDFAAVAIAAACLPASLRANGAVAPFEPDLQSLGWWMRRTTGKTMAELTPYYQQVIGLPLVRAWQNDLVLLWAGEDMIFEVKTDDNPVRRQSDPASAAAVPVFRVQDLDRWRTRMTVHGYEPVARRATRWGQTLFYRGPDQLIIGFEQRSIDSPLPSDRIALRRWRDGAGRLGALPPLPDTLHYLSRAIRHVADVPAMSRFYRDSFGLKPLGAEGQSQLFALGEDTVLEIAPGGIAIPEPADRTELPDTYVLRVHNLDAQLAALPKRGARLKGAVIVKEETTRLQFIPDPEGWISAIEERGTIRDRYIDDVEAERRWQARR